jgi:hypothetical protein
MPKPLICLLSGLLSGLLLLAPPGHAANQPALPDAAPLSRQHIPFQGEWEGGFTGDVAGDIKVTVGADDIAIVSCTTRKGRHFKMSGPIDASGVIEAVQNEFGPAAIKLRFEGKLAHDGTASGTWHNSFLGLKGVWRASRQRDVSTATSGAR